MPRFRLVALTSALLVVMATFAVVGSAAARTAKVTVCHRSDDGYHPITVSERALDAHLRHGDEKPGGTVPGTEDVVFGDDCGAVETNTPAGSGIEAKCYTSETGHSDLYHDGSSDPGNVLFFYSYTGACTELLTYPGVTPTLVLALEIESAEAACSDLGLELAGEDGPLNGDYYGYTGLPENTWLCL